MLTLSRRENEEIVIGRDIIVRVVRIENGYKVRLAIKAPKNVHILRGDLERYGKEDFR